MLAHVRSSLNQGLELWLYDLARHIPTRMAALTSVQGGLGGGFSFSPDGTRIAYLRFDSQGGDALVEPPVSGASAPRVVVRTEEGNRFAFHDWTPDGLSILYGLSRRGRRELYRVPLSGGRSPMPYVAGTDSFQPAPSPDGRWVAYTSSPGGPPQIVVQPFPDPSGGKWTVPRPGASRPRWRRDGRELFFVEGVRFMSVSVSPAVTGRLEFGPPSPLFELPVTVVNQAGGFPYDVMPNGQQFVVMRPRLARPTPLTVVVNWQGT